MLSSVCVSNIDRSGRLMLPNLVIYAQSFSLGERGFCQSGNYLINKAKLCIQNQSLKASAQIVVTLKWSTFGPKSSLLWSFWPNPSPLCLLELPSGSALVISFRLRAGHVPPLAHLPPLGLSVKSKSVPSSGRYEVKDVMCHGGKNRLLDGEAWTIDPPQ